MKIRTRVVAAAGLALAAIVCCGVLLGIGASRSRAADAEQEKAQAASRAIVGLLTLTLEYALHAEARAVDQWQQQHAGLAATLAVPVLSGETSAARLALRDAAAQLPDLVRRLSELGAEPDAALAGRSRDLLVDQLLARTQALADSAYRWSREAAAAEQAARRWMRSGGAVSLLLLLVTALAQPLVVWRRVLRPLAVLERAAAAVERGDLTARCASTASDELGHVAHRFDAMTSALGERSAELQRSEQRLRAIADNLPVLITYIDSAQRYQFCNATYEQWFGVPGVRVQGQPVTDALGELYAERRPYIERALAGERVESERLVRLPTGERHLHALYLPHLENGTVLGFYALITDVTAIKRSEAELSRLARNDALTGLPNRRQFDERLHEAMARTRRTQDCMALLFLDIDRFKTVNDSLGHAAGDAVLQEFARRLKHHVRATDSVARLAGDEFVVILEGIHQADQAEQVALKIVRAIRDAFMIDGTALLVTTSIGVALFDGDATSPAELVARADAALYEVKRTGRDGYRLDRPLQALAQVD